jgi:hypothetical protein
MAAAIDLAMRMGSAQPGADAAPKRQVSGSAASVLNMLNQAC